MKNFWQVLKKQKKPFFALAPMEAAADSVFRRVVAFAGKPDVFFTEFTNVEGLFSKGVKKVERRLKYTESEKPIIAQIWGLNPELYYKAAIYLTKNGFDGIDINMGCPKISETSKGACAALINNKQLAKEIIQAVKEGTESREAGRVRLRPRACRGGDRGGEDSKFINITKVSKQLKVNNFGLPISVKTRIGFSKIQTEEWIGFLLEQGLDALTIHGRTRKEMSKVPAHWGEIGKAVVLRDEMKKATVIIGNGDIKSREDGVRKAEKYRVDGIMIGRGIFENAWIFNNSYDHLLISVKERVSLLNKHLRLYENESGEKLPYQTLKKYFKIYIRDYEGASEFRAKLMETKSVKEAREVISKHVI